MLGDIEEIADRIKELYIACPDCEYMTSDDQYTCTTCWCMGGNGRLNVANLIHESPQLVKYLLEN